MAVGLRPPSPASERREDIAKKNSRPIVSYKLRNDGDSSFETSISKVSSIGFKTISYSNTEQKVFIQPFKACK
jgi:hypothetical protein